MGAASIMLLSVVVLMVCLKANDSSLSLASKRRVPSFTFSREDTDCAKNPADACNAITKRAELQATEIPLIRYLSPSMFMLLLVKVVQSFAHQVYCISAPVVFAKDFNISPQLGGFLHGACAICGVIVIACDAKISARFKSWGYPFNVSLYFGVVAVSCMTFVVFYERWIAFSFHILAYGFILGLFGIEMTCRLFLCPPQAFQQITGIVGVLQV